MQKLAREEGGKQVRLTSDQVKNLHTFQLKSCTLFKRLPFSNGGSVQVFVLSKIYDIMISFIFNVIV